MRVLYNDGLYALVYECLKVQDDGTCSAGLDSVTVYSRTTRTLPEHTIDNMLEIVEQACFAKEDFEAVRQEGEDINIIYFSQKLLFFAFSYRTVS